MTAWNKGIPCSKETKEKIRLAKVGKPGKNKGKHWKLSKEAKLKISLNKRRENNPNWQGGISYLPYPEDWTDTLRESIRKRDDYTCQECGIHQDELTGRIKKLSVHHIDYDKNNLNPDNLISLCYVCHLKTNSNRDYWVEYFRNNK